jgi:hypothetical protein
MPLSDSFDKIINGTLINPIVDHGVGMKYGREPIELDPIHGAAIAMKNILYLQAVGNSLR